MNQLKRLRQFASKRFECGANGSSVVAESRAGITSFLVMSYIIFLGPKLLSKAQNGGDLNEIGVATCLISCAMCLLVGLTTNQPFVLAPGIGIISIVSSQLLYAGRSWQEAMAIVTLEGIIAVILVALGAHAVLQRAIPKCLKSAIAVGIGVLIMSVGLQKSSIIVNGRVQSADSGFWFALFGFAVTLAVYLSRWRNGAMLVGMIATTALAHLCSTFGVGPFAGSPDAPTLVWPDLTTVSIPGLAGIVQLFQGQSVGEVATVMFLVFSLLLTDTFDSLGTVYTLTRQLRRLDGNGDVPRLRKLLLIDAIGAATGGAIGASSVTTYVESTAGIASGGRTGLTAVIAGLLFIPAMFIAPAASIIPDQAIAPVLVFIGFMMAAALTEIEWTIQDGLPALLVIVVITLTQSITDGIGVGFLAYTVIGGLRTVREGARPIHPLMVIASLLFVIYFARESSA